MRVIIIIGWMLFAAWNILGQIISTSPGGVTPTPAQVQPAFYQANAERVQNLTAKLAGIDRLPDDPIDRLLVINDLETAKELGHAYKDFFHQHLSSHGDPFELQAILTTLNNHIQRLEQHLREGGWKLHEAYYRRGQRALGKGDTQEAMVAFDRSLSALPAFAPAATSLISIHLNARHTIKACEIALAYDEVHQGQAIEPLIPLMASFLENIRQLQKAEEHTLSLELIEPLMHVYRHDESSLDLLGDLARKSRAALLQAYLDVAAKARTSGNNRLAQHYLDMATNQADTWNIPLPELALSALTLPTAVDTTPVLSYVAPVLLSKPTPAREIASTSHPYPAILDSVKHVAFLAWKGDSLPVLRFLHKLDALIQVSPYDHHLREARDKVDQELKRYRCRQKTGAVEAFLYESDRLKNQNQWIKALEAFEQARRVWATMEACPDKLTPNLTIPTLLLKAAGYESGIQEVRAHYQGGRFRQGDSVLHQINLLHDRSIGPRRGPMRLEWKALVDMDTDTAFLLYKTGDYLNQNLTREALWCLEKARMADMPASRSARVQARLGAALAETDLETTRLTNPKTLLAQHIPPNKWYQVLRKSYQQRFRRG